MKEHEIVDSTAELGGWPEELGAPLPDILLSAKASGLPPGLSRTKIRLGVRCWPDGEEQALRVSLADSLLEVFRRGGEVLGSPILPPPDAQPLDACRYLQRNGDWSPAIDDLSQPLWLALVHGYTRHFGVEYKLVIQINTRWGIAPSANSTPRELLTTFGFDPAEFSLYYAHSSELLPADVPLNIKRADRFEAQKDGRYGSSTNIATRDSALESAMKDLGGKGYDVRRFVEGGQTYVEIGRLEIPSPPWSGPTGTILIAIPAAYPVGGLDAFYIHKEITHQSGPIPYEQSKAVIDGREWGLISWHYAVNRPWSPTRDDLSSHVVHCRGYFLRRGVTQ